MASLDAARRQLAAPRRAAPARHAARRGGGPGEARGRSRASRSSTTTSSAAPASPATTRCGSSSTSAARAGPATSWPRRCAAPTTSTPSWPRRRRSCCSSGWASRAAALERVAGDVEEIVSRIEGAGRDRRDRPPARRRSRTSWRSRRARRSWATAEVVAADDAVGPRLVRDVAGYPPGIPALLPGERITAATVGYLREIVAVGRAAARRQRPVVRDGHRPARLARAVPALPDRYRRTGATPPFGDPRGYHGVAMEGYYWRFTDRARGRVVVALLGVSRDAAGEEWGTVALAARSAASGSLLREVVAERAAADPRRPGGHGAPRRPRGLRRRRRPACASTSATARGSTSPWPTRGAGRRAAPSAGSGRRRRCPALSQYWHPHVLGGRARGRLELDGAAGRSTTRPPTPRRTGATATASRRPGGGARATGSRARTRASPSPAAAPASVPLQVVATSLVVALGDDAPPRRPAASCRCASPSTTAAGSCAPARRAARLEVEAHAAPGEAHVLPVPVPAERRTHPGRAPAPDRPPARPGRAPARAAGVGGRVGAGRARARAQARAGGPSRAERSARRGRHGQRLGGDEALERPDEAARAPAAPARRAGRWGAPAPR